MKLFRPILSVVSNLRHNPYDLGQGHYIQLVVASSYNNKTISLCEYVLFNDFDKFAVIES